MSHSTERLHVDLVIALTVKPAGQKVRPGPVQENLRRLHADAGQGRHLVVGVLHEAEAHGIAKDLTA